MPEITEEQLRMIWRELPFVIDKRTQDWIEREKQFSENYIQRPKSGNPGKRKEPQIRSGNKGEVQYGYFRISGMF